MEVYMCGFVGVVNYTKDISNSVDIIRKMNRKISKRGPDNEGYYIEKNLLLGHKRLAIIDIENGLQPMSFVYNECKYTIVYNGQIYNSEELRKELKELGVTFSTHSDTEVLLKGYIHWNSNILNKLNGIFSFAIWNSKKEELFAARDHMGVKPFFYTNKNDNLIFSSEIKGILAHNEVDTVVDKMGFQELLGIGPAHTPGYTVFKNIFELKPAHFLVYNKSGLHIEKYWHLKSSVHTDDFETTCENIKYLLKDSIERQLVSDVPIGCMLSGGLDSSIVSYYASKYFNKVNLKPLNTFSVTYKDNEKNFVKSDFQPNSDEHYIDVMVNALRN